MQTLSKKFPLLAMVIFVYLVCSMPNGYPGFNLELRIVFALNYFCFACSTNSVA